MDMLFTFRARNKQATFIQLMYYNTINTLSCTNMFEILVILLSSFYVSTQVNDSNHFTTCSVLYLPFIILFYAANNESEYHYDKISNRFNIRQVSNQIILVLLMSVRKELRQRIVHVFCTTFITVLS